MKKSLSILVGAAMLAASLGAAAQNIAIVNGKPIAKARFDAILADVKKQAGQPLPPDIDKRIKDRMIQNAVITQAAEAKKLNLTPEYALRMEEERTAVLARMLFEQYKKEHAPTDEAAKAVYEQQVVAQAGTEYHVRHILVKTEAEAKKLLAELKKGTAFEALAEKNSQDPGSAKRGGDLGWSPASVYVPPFAAAVAALQKGETSAAPVKSEFGYHIIRVEDSRQPKLPPFEEVKDQIKQQMQPDQAVLPGFRKYMESLKSSARIQ